MKREKDLFHRVASFRTLIESTASAARGKRGKPGVAEFILDMENEVIALEEELRSRRYRPRPYRTFKVHDPKERMICAADFRDRVVHHALCAAVEPIFERSYVFDTYACRTGKGNHRAIRRARQFCRRYRYFLKTDVHKFFDTMDHGVLKRLVRRRIKDPDLLWLIDLFIDHPVPWTEPGRGLPIGNLTSQHFANFYLSGLDHHIKEDLGIGGYVRYMDDGVLFADDKETLWDALGRIEAFLGERLNLSFKEGSVLLAPTSQGLPFLGFRIYPGVIRMSRQGRKRFFRKARHRNRQLAEGKIGEGEWSRSMAGILGYAMQADSRSMRTAFFKEEASPP